VTAIAVSGLARRTAMASVGPEVSGSQRRRVDLGIAIIGRPEAAAWP
jgi:hypothetical protein